MDWLDAHLQCGGFYASWKFIVAMGEGNQTFDGLIKYASRHAQKRKPAVFNALLKRAGITMTPEQRLALGNDIAEMRKFESEH